MINDYTTDLKVNLYCPHNVLLNPLVIQSKKEDT